MQDETDLAALVGSRLCHDLISPIGAIGNGVELILSEQGLVSPELLMIAESVASANARIRFFRLAYGLAGPDQRIARSDVTQVLEGISQGSRLRMTWSSDSDLDRHSVKRAFLLIQCLETVLPWGGVIRVSQEGQLWTFIAETERIRPLGPLWQTLQSPLRCTEHPPVSASEVQFALLSHDLARSGKKLTLQAVERRLDLQLPG